MKTLDLKKHSGYCISCLSEHVNKLDRTKSDLKITAENISRLQQKHNPAYCASGFFTCHFNLRLAGLVFVPQWHLTTAMSVIKIYQQLMLVKLVINSSN